MINLLFTIAEEETKDIEQTEKQIATFRDIYRKVKKQPIKKLALEIIFLLTQEKEDCICRRKRFLNYGRKLAKSLKQSESAEPQNSQPELAGLTK